MLILSVKQKVIKFLQGTVSKTSRKIAFCEGKVLDADRSILATGSGVFKLIRD